MANTVVNIRYLNPFHTQEYDSGKTCCMDIEVEIQSGKRIDIEMQVRTNSIYVNRSIMYGTKMVQETIGSGEDYENLKKSMVISILGDNLFKGTDEWHNVFRFKEVDQNFELSDLLELHFVELNKLDLNQSVEKMDSLQRWAAFIRCAGDPQYEKLINHLTEDSEEIRKAEEIMREISQNEILRSKERSRQRFINDQNSRETIFKRQMAEMEERVACSLEKAESSLEKAERSLEEGMSKGLEQGIQLGIEALIEDNVEEGVTETRIREKLQRKFQLTEEEAEAAVKRYRK